MTYDLDIWHNGSLKPSKSSSKVKVMFMVIG